MALFNNRLHSTETVEKTLEKATGGTFNQRREEDARN